MPYVSDEKKLLIYATSIGGASYLTYEYWLPMSEKDTGVKPSLFASVVSTLGAGTFFGVLLATGIIVIMEG